MKEKSHLTPKMAKMDFLPLKNTARGKSSVVSKSSEFEALQARQNKPQAINISPAIQTIKASPLARSLIKGSSKYLDPQKKAENLEEDFSRFSKSNTIEFHPKTGPEGNSPPSLTINEESLIPPLSRNDFSYQKLKSLGERKQMIEFDKWFDATLNKIRTEPSFDANKKQFFCETLVSKSLDTLVSYLQKDHSELAKFLGKVVQAQKSCFEEWKKLNDNEELLENHQNLKNEMKTTRQSMKDLEIEISIQKAKNQNLEKELQNLRKSQTPGSQSQSKIELKFDDDHLSPKKSALKQNISEKESFSSQKSLGKENKMQKSHTAKRFFLKIDKEGGISEMGDEEIKMQMTTAGKSKKFFFGENSTPSNTFTLVRMPSVTYSDLQTVVQTYESEMNEFYEELNKFIKNLEAQFTGNPKINFASFKKSVGKNQKYNKEFFVLIRNRDDETQQELMDLKIDLAEKDQLQLELGEINRNWKRRFDHFFIRYQALREYVTFEQNNREEILNKYLAQKAKYTNETQTLMDQLKDVSPENYYKTRLRRESIALAQGISQMAKKKNIGGTLSDIIHEYYVKGVYLMEIGLMTTHKKRLIRNVEFISGKAAQVFIRDVREVPLNPSEDMKLDAALKIISGVYSYLVKLGERRENENPLYFFVYEHMLTHFGGSNANAERKFRQLISCCLAHQEKNNKIRLFLRLITILYHDSYELDGVDLNFYISAMKTLDEENSKEPGMTIASNNHEKVLVSYNASLDFCSAHLMKKVKDEGTINEFKSLQNELSLAKVPATNPSGKFLVDFDFMIEKLLISKFSYYKKRFDLLFEAINPDFQNCVGIEQFYLLINLFEPKRFTFRKMMQIFSKYVDLVDEDAKKNFLSFKQFSLCAETEGLFKNDKIEAFSKSTLDQIKDLGQLEKEWHLKKGLMRVKLIKARSYTLFYQKLLTSFDDFFPMEGEPHDAPRMWMRYRLLDSFSQNLLMESLVTSFIDDKILRREMQKASSEIRRQTVRERVQSNMKTQGNKTFQVSGNMVSSPGKEKESAPILFSISNSWKNASSQNLDIKSMSPQNYIRKTPGNMSRTAKFSNPNSLSLPILKTKTLEESKILDHELMPAILRGDFVYSNMKTLGEKKSIQDIEKWLDSVCINLMADSRVQLEKKKTSLRNAINKSIEGLMIFINKDHDLIAKLIPKIINMIYENEDSMAQENSKQSMKNLSEANLKERDDLKEELSKIKSLNQSLDSTLRDREAKILSLTQQLKNLQKYEQAQQKPKAIESTVENKLGKGEEEKIAVLEKSDGDSKKKFQIQTKRVQIAEREPPSEEKNERPNVKIVEQSQADKSKEGSLGENKENFASSDQTNENQENLFALKHLVRSMTSANFKADKNGIQFNEIESPKKRKKATAEEGFQAREKAKMRTVAYSNLKQMSQGHIGINVLVKKYEGEMTNFYMELNKIISQLEKLPEVEKLFNMEHLKGSIKKNEEYNVAFFSLINERDLQFNEETLNLKIELAEKMQLLYEHDQAQNNWKERFNKLFQQYHRLKEFTTKDQESREKIIHNFVSNVNLSKEIHTFVERLKENTADNLQTTKPTRRSSLLNTANIPVKRDSEMTPTCFKNLSGTLADIMKEFFVKGTLLIENPFSFHNKKKVIRKVFTVNFYEAQRFIKDVKEIPLSPSDEMKLDQIFKAIAGVYSILIKQSDRKKNDTSLYFFVYDYFMNNFAGLVHVVDKKVRTLISCCLAHTDTCPRIRVFLRLMTMIFHDCYEFDGRDLNNYLDFMRDLDIDNLKEKGMSLASSFQDQIAVPLTNAIELGLNYLSSSEEITNYVDLDQFQKDLNDSKLSTLSAKGKHQIDFDLFFEKLVMQKYDYFKARLEILFRAVDIHMHGDLGVEQFLFIITTLEPKKYTFRGMLTVFSKYVDLIHEESSQNFMTLRQFAICVEEEKILRRATIDNFLNNTHDQIVNLQTLESEWSLRKNLIRLRLIKSRSYNLMFQKMLTSIDDFFPFDQSDNDADLIWMRYKMLDFHSQNMHLELILSALIPEEFAEITLMNKKVMT